MRIGDIIENISNYLPTDFIQSIILYGNIGGEDIDVFVVVEGRGQYSCIKKRPLDITSVGEAEAEEMVINLDPLITEPILTGVEIFGDIMESGIDMVLAQKADKNTVAYLRRKSHELFEYTKELDSKEEYNQAADNLRFVLSYLEYANHYEQHKKAITFYDLVKPIERPLLRSAQRLLKGQNGLNLAEFKGCMMKTEEILTKASKVL